jgi:hypothetical protein
MKTLFCLGGDGNDLHVGALGKGVVVGVEGLRNEHFVSGVTHGHEGEEESLAPSVGDDDILSIKGDIESLIVGAHRISKAVVSRRSGVGDDLLGKVSDGFQKSRRGFDVRLSDVEGVDFLSLCTGFLRIGKQPPDGRRLHIQSSLRKSHYKILPDSE